MHTVVHSWASVVYAHCPMCKCWLCMPPHQVECGDPLLMRFLVATSSWISCFSMRGMSRLSTSAGGTRSRTTCRHRSWRLNTETQCQWVNGALCIMRACMCVCVCMRACMRERVRQCMCVCVYIQVKLLFWFVLDIGLFFTNWTISYKCVCARARMHACTCLCMCVVIAGAEWCILVYTYVSSCISVLLFAYVRLLTTFQDTSLATQLGQ